MNSGHPAPVWFLVVTVPAIALTGWAILRIRMFRHLVPSAADIRHWRAFRALFWAATVSEWGLVCIAAILLSDARRLDLIPQAAGVIVGLHFFPSAIVFRVPRYNWLAGIMILGAVGSLLLPLGDLRNFTGCAFSGLCLWVSSAIALSRLTFPIPRFGRGNELRGVCAKPGLTCPHFAPAASVRAPYGISPASVPSCAPEAPISRPCW